MEKIEFGNNQTEKMQTDRSVEENVKQEEDSITQEAFDKKFGPRRKRNGGKKKERDDKETMTKIEESGVAPIDKTESNETSPETTEKKTDEEEQDVDKREFEERIDRILNVNDKMLFVKAFLFSLEPGKDGKGGIEELKKSFNEKKKTEVSSLYLGKRGERKLFEFVTGQPFNKIKKEEAEAIRKRISDFIITRDEMERFWNEKGEQDEESTEPAETTTEEITEQKTENKTPETADHYAGHRKPSKKESRNASLEATRSLLEKRLKEKADELSDFLQSDKADSVEQLDKAIQETEVFLSERGKGIKGTSLEMADYGEAGTALENIIEKLKNKRDKAEIRQRIELRKNHEDSSSLPEEIQDNEEVTFEKEAEKIQIHPFTEFSIREIPVSQEGTLNNNKETPETVGDFAEALKAMREEFNELATNRQKEIKLFEKFKHGELTTEEEDEYKRLVHSREEIEKMRNSAARNAAFVTGLELSTGVGREINNLFQHKEGDTMTPEQSRQLLDLVLALGKGIDISMMAAGKERESMSPVRAEAVSRLEHTETRVTRENDTAEKNQEEKPDGISETYENTLFTNARYHDSIKFFGGERHQAENARDKEKMRREMGNLFVRIGKMGLYNEIMKAEDSQYKIKKGFQNNIGTLEIEWRNAETAEKRKIDLAITFKDKDDRGLGGFFKRMGAEETKAADIVITEHEVKNARFESAENKEEDTQVSGRTDIATEPHDTVETAETKNTEESQVEITSQEDTEHKNIGKVILNKDGDFSLSVEKRPNLYDSNLDPVPMAGIKEIYIKRINEKGEVKYRRKTQYLFRKEIQPGDIVSIKTEDNSSYEMTIDNEGQIELRETNDLASTAKNES